MRRLKRRSVRRGRRAPRGGGRAGRARWRCALRFVNGGGTGSIATTRAESAVTEITVGSGFYAPALFDNYRDFRYQPAAGYAIEIVRSPRRASTPAWAVATSPRAAPGQDGCRSLSASGRAADPLEGAGEVQTPIHYRGPERLALGDPIFMRHAKAGELCERFTHLACIQNGAIVDEVTTYRGDGQCFL